MIPFDSAKDYYKSIRGAVAAGTSLRLRVLVPRSFGVSYCTLVLTKDGENTQYIPLEWERTDGYEEWWQKELPLTEPGLYFYHFTYDTGWGTSEVRRLPDSTMGGIDGTAEWQQTVYPAGFQTPDAVKGGIFYQIFPDRFYCSGEPKHNVPADRVMHKSTREKPVYLPDADGEIKNNDYYGGDLKGISQKLDYIRGLGRPCST